MHVASQSRDADPAASSSSNCRRSSCSHAQCPRTPAKSLDWPLSRDEKKACALKLYEWDLRAANGLLEEKEEQLGVLVEEVKVLRRLSLASTFLHGQGEDDLPCDSGDGDESEADRDSHYSASSTTASFNNDDAATQSSAGRGPVVVANAPRQRGVSSCINDQDAVRHLMREEGEQAADSIAPASAASAVSAAAAPAALDVKDPMKKEDQQKEKDKENEEDEQVEVGADVVFDEEDEEGAQAEAEAAASSEQEALEIERFDLLGAKAAVNCDGLRSNRSRESMMRRPPWLSEEPISSGGALRASLKRPSSAKNFGTSAPEIPGFPEITGIPGPAPFLPSAASSSLGSGFNSFEASCCPPPFGHGLGDARSASGSYGSYSSHIENSGYGCYGGYHGNAATSTRDGHAGSAASNSSHTGLANIGGGGGGSTSSRRPIFIFGLGENSDSTNASTLDPHARTPREGGTSNNHRSSSSNNRSSSSNNNNNNRGNSISNNSNSSPESNGLEAPTDAGSIVPVQEVHGSESSAVLQLCFGQQQGSRPYILLAAAFADERIVLFRIHRTQLERSMLIDDVQLPVMPAFKSESYFGGSGGGKSPTSSISNFSTTSPTDLKDGGVTAAPHLHEHMTLKGHVGHVSSLFFGPNDKTLVALSSGMHPACFWDVETGACTCLIRDKRPIQAASFLPSHPSILALANGTNVLRTISLETHKTAQLLRLSHPATSLASDKTGQFLFCGTKAGSIITLTTTAPAASSSASSSSATQTTSSSSSTAATTTGTQAKPKAETTTPPSTTATTTQATRASTSCLACQSDFQVDGEGILSLELLQPFEGEEQQLLLATTRSSALLLEYSISPAAIGHPVVVLAVRERFQADCGLRGNLCPWPCCCSSNGGGHFICQGEEDEISIISLTEGVGVEALRLRRHNARIRTMAINLQDTILASGDSSGRIIFWRRVLDC